MPNILIKPEDQSAPTLRYDAGLARAAAEIKDPNEAGRRDWDEFDWRAVNPHLWRRRGMKTGDLDNELHAPGHDDPGMAMLRRAETDPSGWVEENLEIYESNCAKAREQRMDGQERWEKKHETERLVNILHPSQVIRKLRAAGVDARNEESPHARIWLNDFTRVGLVGVNAWVAPQPMDDEGYLYELSYASGQRQKDIITANYAASRQRRKVQRTLTSLQEPYGPEWSVMRFNDHGVATKEKYRGWRTAMLVLIFAGILTEEEVDRAFGPAMGEAGAWYRRQLRDYRQLKLGKAI